MEGVILQPLSNNLRSFLIGDIDTMVANRILKVYIHFNIVIFSYFLPV